MNTKQIHQLFSTLLVSPKPSFKSKGKGIVINSISHVLLKLMAVLFNRRAKLNQYLKGTDGWINFKVGFKTETDSVCQTAVFHNGKMSVIRLIPEDVDVVLSFLDEKALIEMPARAFTGTQRQISVPDESYRKRFRRDLPF